MPFKNRHIKRIAKVIAQQFDHALTWTPETGKPYVIERDGILALHFDELSIQSEMNIDNPDQLVIGYTRAAMSFLLLKPVPKRIAMIGLGGGSLAKYCYRYLPQTEITVLEINPDVIALRNEFAIPADDARFRIVAGDGAKWVTESSWQPDVLIVDGFDASGLPEQLGCQRFYDDCNTALTDDGVLVVNLWGGYPNYEAYLARIYRSFSDRIAVLDADDSVNKIVLAVKHSKFPPSASILHRHAQLLCQSHPENFHGKCTELIQALNQAHRTDYACPKFQ